MLAIEVPPYWNSAANSIRDISEWVNFSVRMPKIITGRDGATWCGEIVVENVVARVRVGASFSILRDSTLATAVRQRLIINFQLMSPVGDITKVFCYSKAWQGADTPSKR